MEKMIFLTSSDILVFHLDILSHDLTIIQVMRARVSIQP